MTIKLHVSRIVEFYLTSVMHSAISTQVPIGCCDLCGGGSVGKKVLEGCRGGGVDTQLLFLEGLSISCEGIWQCVHVLPMYCVVLYWLFC